MPSGGGGMGKLAITALEAYNSHKEKILLGGVRNSEELHTNKNWKFLQIKKGYFGGAHLVTYSLPCIQESGMPGIKLRLTHVRQVPYPLYVYPYDLSSL